MSIGDTAGGLKPGELERAMITGKEAIRRRFNPAAKFQFLILKLNLGTRNKLGDEFNLS
jgi:hypothetical protein